MQYDIKPVYASGTNGAGQSIAIVSASNVDLSLVQAYQTLFGLSANLPVVVVTAQTPVRTAPPQRLILTSNWRGRWRPAPR